MRILHTADIHLDSPLTGLRQRAGARGDEIADATRRAFKKLIQYTIDQKIDVLLIAGDNWDGRHKDYNSLLFFAGEMKRLRDAGCRVVMLRGNHDAESNMALTMPKSVFMLPSDHPDTIQFDELRVAIHGQSFARRDVRENLAAKYPDPVPGYLNIGMLHTAVQNHAATHASYAPCTVNDLISRGYDYWALGHVHKRTEISQKPWIIYPGNLQSRHINESGEKGATLITVNNGMIGSVEHVALDVLRWARVEIDTAAIDSLEDLCCRFDEVLEEALDRADGRALAIRLVLTGKTLLHRTLKLETVRLEAEAARAAEAAGDIWIEQIEVNTEDGAIELGAEGQEDAIAAIMAEAASSKSESALKSKIEAAINELPSKFSSGLRKDAGIGDIDEAILNAVIDDARDTLLAKLSA